MQTIKNERKKQHFKLSTSLAQLDDKQINKLIGKANEPSHQNKIQIISFNNSKLFVKRLPLTDIEQANPFSTKNLYNLPNNYHYSIGSLGFGAYRELMMHIKTTNWVLDNALDNFPLLHHFRIIQKHNDIPYIDLTDNDEFQYYLSCWNKNKNIGRYVQGRVNAKFEIVMFIEYFPETLEKWIIGNLACAEDMLAKTNNVIKFLNNQGVTHFDVHFSNILIANQEPFFSDFGLTADKEFNLNKSERLFIEQNAHTDSGEYISELIHPLRIQFEKTSARKKMQIKKNHAIDETLNEHETIFLLLNKIEAVANDFHLPDQYIKILVKYRDIIFLMHTFYNDMATSKKKNIPFNHQELKQLLLKSALI